MKKSNEKMLDLKAKRKDGVTILEFKISKNLEKVFNDISQGVRDSSSWDGMQYYSIPNLIADEQYKRLLQRYNLIDSYGSSVISGSGTSSQFNIAIIRTVGGKGEVNLPDSIPFSVLAVALQNAVGFLKEFYRDYLTEFEITGELNVKV